MPIKQLIIHLGDRKTGSTSIQSALSKKSWESKSAQILYPTNSNHRNLALLIKANKKEVLKNRAAKLRQKLIKSNSDFAIISAEAFEVVPSGMLSQFIQQYLPEWKDTVKLIAYIRPHADRFVSSFVERTKHGNFNQSMSVLHQTFKEQRFLIYKNRLDAWRSTFGDRFEVHPFLRSSLYNNDVVDDFFKQVFNDQPYNLKKHDYRNESLCLEDLSALVEILKIIKEKYGNQIKPKTLHRLGQRMADSLSGSRANGTRICMHRKLAEEVSDFYHEDAMAIDREYFSGEVFTSSLESVFKNIVDEEQSLDVHHHFSEQEIRRLHCFADLLRSMLRKDKKTNNLNQKLKKNQ